MKWFKHDSGAHVDAKLKKLRHKYGITGFGLYWYCLELIAFGVDSKHISFELEEDAETIALEWNLDQLKVQEMMGYMCKLGLFEDNCGQITCLKLASRLDDTNSRNHEIKQIVAKLKILRPSDDSEESSEISDQKRLDESRLDKNNEKKPDTQVLDWSELKIPEEQKQEIRNIRKDIKKPLTKTDQRALNGIIKGFNACLLLGYSIDQIMNEWAQGKWQTIKPAYLKNKCFPLSQKIITAEPVTKSEEYTDEERAEINKKLKKLNA